MITQENGFVVKEGVTYRSHVGDLVKVLDINEKTNTVRVYNISDSCTSWHRIDSAIKDNKFKSEV